MISWFKKVFFKTTDAVIDLPNVILSSCPGKCYCGKACVLDHELVEQRCTCSGNHNMCQEDCVHGRTCWAIARHKGNHECFRCFHEEMAECKNEINRKYGL